MESRLKKGLGRGLSSLLGDSSKKINTNKISIKATTADYLGFVGVPRRYYEMYDSEFMAVSTNYLNQFITVMAIIVGFAQLLFLYITSPLITS